MDTIAEVSKLLNNFLNADCELMEIARKNNFVKRRGKMAPGDFLRCGILTTLTEPTVSLRDLALSFQSAASVQLSRNGISKRFTEPCVKFLQDVVKSLCTRDSAYNRFSFMDLSGIESVIVADSTEVKLSDSMVGFFPGMRNTKSLMKIQTVIDCLQPALKSVELTGGNRPDQGYKGYLDFIKPGSLSINDLGYFSIESLAQVVRQGGSFLSRHHRNASLYDKKGARIDLAETLGQAKSPVVELEVRLGKGQKLACRFIALRLTESAYAQRSANIKRQERRVGGSQPARTELDRWSLMMTNLTPEQLPAGKAWDVYACRWQIELFFKLLKSELHLGKFTHKNNWRTQAEVYMKYISLWLMMIVVTTVAEKEISLMKATSVFRRFCHDLLGNSYEAVYNAIVNINTYLKIYAVHEQRPKRPSSRKNLNWSIQHA